MVSRYAPVINEGAQELISGHTSHSELVDFLRRSKAALRDEKSLIIVKENTCEDGPDGAAKEFLDEEDSSLTRYVFVFLLVKLILLVIILSSDDCLPLFLSSPPLAICFCPFPTTPLLHILHQFSVLGLLLVTIVLLDQFNPSTAMAKCEICH